MIPSDILPDPFYWIGIPAGQVTLEGRHRGGDEDRVVDVEAFQIAQYPITNTQYTLFIDADGYNTRDYWTDVGWELRTEEDWTIPNDWELHSTRDDCPVIGISWYEAMAFCAWLSEKADDTITLPTEAQWQWAAQGDDGRDYPWGGDWDAKRFNVWESKINKVTPVQKYAGVGNSPFGVIDMSGNCWE